MRSGIWTAKHWLALPVIAFAIMGTQIGCSKPPAGPTVVTIVNNNSNTNNNGQSGTGDPSAVPGSVAEKVKSVTVNGFANGEKCPSNITPANVNKQVRLGCDLAVTVNPRDSAGQVILDDHAPPVDYFILALGQGVVTFSQSQTNSYNGDVHTVAVGKFAFVASVAGVATTGLQEFEVIP